MKPLSRYLLLIAAFITLASGCTLGVGGSKDSDGKKQPGSAENGSMNPSALPSGQIAKEFSKVDVPAPPVKQRTPECLETFVKPMSSAPPEDASFIHVVVAPNLSMGSECKGMAPGGDCKVPLQGAWRVAGCTGSACGSVVIQVFENNDTEPARSPEVGPVPAAGQFNPTTSKLFYKVGKNAKKATLRAVLKDLTGRVVARSEPHTLTLPVCVSKENQ